MMQSPRPASERTREGRTPFDLLVLHAGRNAVGPGRLISGGGRLLRDAVRSVVSMIDLPAYSVDDPCGAARSCAQPAWLIDEPAATCGW